MKKLCQTTVKYKKKRLLIAGFFSKNLSDLIELKNYVIGHESDDNCSSFVFGGFENPTNKKMSVLANVDAFKIVLKFFCNLSV